MFEFPMVTAIATVLLFLATVFLFFATWRAATAAKLSADIVAREFRLRSRPLVAVKWTSYHREQDCRVHLIAEVTEVAGIATTLHSVETSATSRLNPTAPPLVETRKPNATLSGDVATYGVGLDLEVPQPLVARDDITIVASLDANVVISAADEEADQETWQAIGTLWFSRSQQQFVTTANPPMRRLSRRTGGPRSRIVDPVLRAWERFWDSVS